MAAENFSQPNGTLHFTDGDACHIMIPFGNYTNNSIQFVIPGLFLQSGQAKYMHELRIINVVAPLRTQKQIFYNYLQQARLA